jgi:hypothetical protein
MLGTRFRSHFVVHNGKLGLGLSTGILIQKAEGVIGHIISKMGIGPSPAAATDMVITAVQALTFAGVFPVSQLLKDLRLTPYLA